MYCVSTQHHVLPFYPMNVLSHVNDYIEPMAIFTTWAIFILQINAGVGGLDEILSNKNFQLALYSSAHACHFLEIIGTY